MSVLAKKLLIQWIIEATYMICCRDEIWSNKEKEMQARKNLVELAKALKEELEHPKPIEVDEVK